MAACDALTASAAQNLPGQLTRQTSEVGAVDGLVDRLCAHPSGRHVRELTAQLVCDLLRAPARLEPGRDVLAQHLVAGQT